MVVTPSLAIYKLILQRAPALLLILLFFRPWGPGATCNETNSQSPPPQRRLSSDGGGSLNTPASSSSAVASSSRDLTPAEAYRAAASGVNSTGTRGKGFDKGGGLLLPAGDGRRNAPDSQGGAIGPDMDDSIMRGTGANSAGVTAGEGGGNGAAELAKKFRFVLFFLLFFSCRCEHNFFFFSHTLLLLLFWQAVCLSACRSHASLYCCKAQCRWCSRTICAVVFACICCLFVLSVDPNPLANEMLWSPTRK